MLRSAGSRATGSYKHRFWVRFTHVTAVTTVTCTTLDLQIYLHSPFLIVPFCFLLTNNLPVLPLAPKLWREREETKKKISCKPMALCPHVRRNEGLDLTLPCLLSFSLSAHWGNNGNWAAASLEGFLAFSDSQWGLWGSSELLWTVHSCFCEQAPALQWAIPRRTCWKLCWKPCWKLFWLPWTAPAHRAAQTAAGLQTSPAASSLAPGMWGKRMRWLWYKVGRGHRWIQPLGLFSFGNWVLLYCWQWLRLVTASSADRQELASFDKRLLILKSTFNWGLNKSVAVSVYKSSVYEEWVTK